MDLTYLLQREEIERLRADQARDKDTRDAHGDLADSYRAIFDAHRRLRLVAGEPHPDCGAPSI